MFAKTLCFGVGLAALVAAEPIPQAAPTTSYDPAALSSELASLSSQEGVFSSIFSDLPTLPSSVESVLATAVPSSYLTETTDLGCALVTAVPDWYKSLPADVKSALTSYESAVLAWSKEHSAALSSLEGSITLTESPYVCTNGAIAPAGTVTTTSAAKTTGTTAKSAGSAGTTAAAGTATSSGAAAGSSSSKAGAVAPRATGAMAASFAGVMGVLGLMAAL